MTETQEELRDLWRAAHEATLRAKEKRREAEAHFISCEAVERKAWQALKDSEWSTHRSKKTGAVLSQQRTNIIAKEELDSE